MLIQSTSEACMYSLGYPLSYPTNQYTSQLHFGLFIHTCRMNSMNSTPILSQYKCHLDTLTLSESFPLSSYFPKPCIYVETAGIKAIWVCWGSRHIQQLYTWKGQLPTPTVRGQVFVFLSQAHVVLWRKHSVGSYKHCEATSTMLTMPNHLSGTISFLPVAAQ